jgi:hypothetical protein
MSTVRPSNPAEVAREPEQKQYPVVTGGFLQQVASLLPMRILLAAFGQRQYESMHRAKWTAPVLN